MLTIKTFSFNPFSQNTYVVSDDTEKCIIIDPGCFFDEEKQRLSSYISSNNLKPVKVVYTHCHLDHSFGAEYIKETYPNISFEGHEAELYFIENAHHQARRFNISMEQPPKLTNFISEKDVIKFGKSELKVLHTPGHSPGSLCLYSEEDRIVFVGDVLFKGSIGRTDLDYGDYDTLLGNIKSKLMTLPEETEVYSGHGPNTTIGREKNQNPFLK